ncbi:hypothetical protein CISIN_1g033965mg [Citrus sinensis]|uniref:Uncharacterized protein n=1 Tax=Citrus sinensis TaxID=2711 RepID=A0A067DFW6_CITSI|nr:hypothetical protein CISIN_1g033965mg [Citrus sinensis]
MRSQAIGDRRCQRTVASRLETQPQEAIANRLEMQPREPTVNSHRRDRAKPSHRCNYDMLMESAAPRLLPLAAAGFTGYHNRCNLIHLHIHCHQVFHGIDYIVLKNLI